MVMEGPEGAGFDYTVAQMQQVEAILAGEIGDDKPILRANPRVPGSFGASEEMHTGRAIVFLQPWDKREKSTAEVVASCAKKFAGMTGVRVRTQVAAGWCARGQPFQMVLGGPDYAEWPMARHHAGEDGGEPRLHRSDSDYKETRPQMRVIVDDRAADLGVSAQAIGARWKP
jgi:multidrug efflux pump